MAYNYPLNNPGGVHLIVRDFTHLSQPPNIILFCVLWFHVQPQATVQWDRPVTIRIHNYKLQMFLIFQACTIMMHIYEYSWDDIKKSVKMKPFWPFLTGMSAIAQCAVYRGRAALLILSVILWNQAPRHTQSFSGDCKDDRIHQGNDD